MVRLNDHPKMTRAGYHGHKATTERRRGQVVRAAPLWCRKSLQLENSVNPAVNGYFFRIKEG